MGAFTALVCLALVGTLGVLFAIAVKYRKGTIHIIIIWNYTYTDLGTDIDYNLALIIQAGTAGWNIGTYIGSCIGTLAIIITQSSITLCCIQKSGSGN